MKAIKICVFLLMGWAVQLTAQNRLITTGVLAEQQRDYGKAIESLERAFGNPETITKAQLLPKGHYSLYKSYIQVVQDTNLKDLALLYPDALERASDNLIKAMETDVKGKWRKTAILERANDIVWSANFNQGIEYYNSQDYTKSLKNFDWGIKALDAFSKPEEITSEHFLTYRMVGTTQLAVLDTVGSIETLEKALIAFDTVYVAGAYEGMEETADYKNAVMAVVYIYQQLAVIYQNQGAMDSAFAKINEGLALFPEDEDLKKRELALYQQNPEYFEEAKTKFEDAIAEAPDDDNLKINFAQMLMEHDDIEEAIVMYKEVYAHDPQNLYANHGLGAYYVNRVVQMNAEKEGMTDDEEIDAMDKKIVESLEMAYPYMQYLHEQQPESVQWLQQLVTISSYIEKEEDMARYAKKLRALNEERSANESNE